MILYLEKIVNKISISNRMVLTKQEIDMYQERVLSLYDDIQKYEKSLEMFYEAVRARDAAIKRYAEFFIDFSYISLMTPTE